MSIKYPVRCEIIDVTGQEVYGGFIGRTPVKSTPHIGKQGLAEKKGDYVQITLDDGNILYGHDCWWKPISEDEK